MASTKLTNNMRGEILAKLMKRAFSERSKLLKRRENDLAAQIYDEVYDAREQDMMFALGRDFFPWRSNFLVDFAGSCYLLHLATERSIAYRHLGNAIGTIAEDHYLYDVWREWKKDWKALGEDREKTQAETRAILERCSTVKKLCEAWPEIDPLLDEMGIVKDSKPAMLPAVRKDMNALFSLPPFRCGNCNMTALGDGPLCPHEGEVTESHTCDKWEPRGTAE